MIYKVLSNLKHNGIDYVIDSEVEMEEEQAESLLEDGVLAKIKKAKEPEPKKDEPKKEPAEKEPAKGSIKEPAKEPAKAVEPEKSEKKEASK